MDRDEQEAELADADHEPVERAAHAGAFGGAKKNTIGTAAKKNLSAASMSGVVSPTPTLMAMKVRPQTIATLSAARMSRGVMPQFGARGRLEGGSRGKDQESHAGSG